MFRLEGVWLGSDIWHYRQMGSALPWSAGPWNRRLYNVNRWCGLQKIAEDMEFLNSFFTSVLKKNVLQTKHCQSHIGEVWVSIFLVRKIGSQDIEWIYRSDWEIFWIVSEELWKITASRNGETFIVIFKKKANSIIYRLVSVILILRFLKRILEDGLWALRKGSSDEEPAQRH